MSSDPQPSLRGFHRVVATTVAVLLLAAVGLSAANARQGPRLTKAEVNVPATVQRSGQRLLLRTDQNVTPVADQVRVTPEVPFEVSSEGSVVMLRFGRPLDYATTYDVVVPVRSAATGAASTFRHSLTTPDATMYVLQRVGTGGNLGPVDEVVGTSPAGTGRQVVLRGPDIQNFAVADPAIAVVSQDEAGEKLVVAPLDQSGSGKVVADKAVFSRLRSSGPGGLFGYLVGPLDPASQVTPRLELYDSVTGEVTRVKGLDGRPLTPLDWFFIPGTRSVVVQMDDSSLFVVDPATGGPPVPLGGHERMHGFVSGTARLIVGDQGKFATIDLTTGSTSAIPVRLEPGTSLDYLLSPAGDGGPLGVEVRSSATALSYSVVRVGEAGARPLYVPDAPDSWISQLCLSPNGEYAAVETVPGDAASDEYAYAPGFRDTTTVIIELATGQRSPQLPGFGSTWCS